MLIVLNVHYAETNKCQNAVNTTSFKGNAFQFST